MATTALALIGLFNVFGTYVAGIARRPPAEALHAVGDLRLRSLAIVVFLLAPLTPWSVYIFAAVMGFLWLSTVPLTNGMVAEIFGVRYLSMLGGFVFLSHQIGSFLGVWLGGRLYDATGSYDVVWWIAVALGIFAALDQSADPRAGDRCARPLGMKPARASAAWTTAALALGRRVRRLSAAGRGRSISPTALELLLSRLAARTTSATASPWVGAGPPVVPGARVLDVACGSGRHVRWLAARGSRSRRSTATPRPSAPLPAGAEVVVADIEAAPWPLAGRRFDAVVVTNYLWRPLFADARGGARRRRRADLRDLRRRQRTSAGRRIPTSCSPRVNCCRPPQGLRIVAYEDGFSSVPRASCSASSPCASRRRQRRRATRCHASADRRRVG